MRSTLVIGLEGDGVRLLHPLNFLVKALTVAPATKGL